MEKSEKLNRFPQGKAIVTLINLMTICNYHLVEFRIKFTYHCNQNDIIFRNAIQSKLLCDLCAKMLKSETTYVVSDDDFQIEAKHKTSAVAVSLEKEEGFVLLLLFSASSFPKSFFSPSSNHENHQPYDLHFL